MLVQFKFISCVAYMKKLWPFALFTVLLLQGCFSALTTGTSAVYDRHNLQNNISDHAIAMAIDQKIKSDAVFSQSDIKVTCFKHYVLLTGETSSNLLRKKVADIAAHIKDVKHVYNFVENHARSTTAEELSDTWLTAKIKTQIIAGAKMDPKDVKVVTENGTIYLMGVLTHKQADIAVNIARYTGGAKHVVKIFDYIIYSKT